MAMLCAGSLCHAAQTFDVSGDDQKFLALRDAALHEDQARAAELAGQLTGYTQPSYVDYYLLRAHASRASDAEFSDFINRYPYTAIADRARNDWLLNLGHQGNWKLFDLQYPQFVLNDDTQVKCYALLSRLSQGQNVADDARKLLTSSRVYGEGCYHLFGALVDTGQFDSVDKWNQIRWAAEANSTGVAEQLARQVDLTKTADLLNRPPKNLAAALAHPLPRSEAARQTTLILLGRLARTDVDKAVSVLDRLSRQLDPAERAVGWGQIALASAQKLQPDAADYWRKAGDAPLSLDAYQWRTRTALRVGDWAGVRADIESMPASLRNEPAWTYWLGRSLMAQNNADVALPLFRSIASLPNFYGQLATEECGLRVAIPVTTPVQTLDLIALGNNPGLQRAIQFYALNMRLEGNREWNWQLRSLTDSQLLAAAEVARQYDLLDRMVSTSDRSKTLFDYSQRFPTPHADVMAQATAPINMDMAWVYGLIRQESRFVMNAHSSAGANGLMQVMPGTARYVVRKLKWDSIDINRINEIDTNIALGVNYLNIVLTNLNGSQLLASAGYNAGPGKARAWRANLTRVVEGAVFAETIPYPETRDYVKNVMAGATFYAALLSGKPQSLKQRLGFVSPFVESPVDQDLPQMPDNAMLVTHTIQQ